jgi:uncharacterized membrane protein
VNVIAVTAALASATGFAVSTSLQHHAAGSAPASVRDTLGFVRHLLSKPTWLTGQVLALLSFFLHAVALHFGPIALVQPIVVSGIVIAVPMRALMSRRMPHGLELSSVTITTIGLAVFLVATDPSDGKDGSASWVAFAVTITGMAIAFMFSWLSSRVSGPRRRAGLLGVTAGVMFGVVAGLVKLVIGQMLDGGPWAMLASWPLWLLLVAGATGIISNQRAYRIASLSASLPVLNIVDVVVALLVGLVVFEQIPAHSPAAIALELAALAAVAFGLRGLAHVEEHVEEEAASRGVV